MMLATTPLSQLPLVSLDLETTGLTPARDRIVQIGAITIEPTPQHFDMLVNPGVPIPATSTAIHGLSESDLTDAPAFPLALPLLREFVNGRIILGYNIGFDLAVLSAEAKRHGMEWQWPGALCLRQLATLLVGRESMLMIADLEGLALHFGVPVHARHTAHGDAAISAALFQKMLPALADKSIITLGDIRRAVSRLNDLRLATVQAGWVDVAEDSSAPTTLSSLARIDPFPYQHRIHEIMLDPPVILSPETRLEDAARLMRERKCDCVFVGAHPEQVEGIVSERDMVHSMALGVDDVKRARDMPLAEVMSSPVITVAGDDYMYVGLGRISRYDIRHLGVTDQAGRLIGWISTREMVRQRVTGALVIGDQLSTAEQPIALRDALKSLPMLASSLVNDAVPGQHVAAVISSQYRAALARATALGEQHMQHDGAGPPPADYAMLILGSAGRDESLLAADQDHAIVYADVSPEKREAAQAWFETLGGHVSDYLDVAGIPYCQGGVMSKHPEWCKPISGWRKAISTWVRKASPEDLLNVDIFFDFTAVYGAQSLADQLHQAMSGRATRQGAFLKLLARNAASHAGGRTIFGGFKTKNGRFNIKLNVLLPITETLRVLAISRGVAEANSSQRAKALIDHHDMPIEVGQLGEDVAFALRMLLRQQIADIANGLAPTSTIDLGLLNDAEKLILKHITGRISRLEALIQDSLFTG